MELNGSGKRYGFEDAELAAKMKELGFSACGYAPSERRLFPENPLKGTGNVIFCA